MLVAIAVALGAGHADASCADDIQIQLARAKAHPKEGDRRKFEKEIAKATGFARSDETECLNAVARARKALNAPPPAPPPTGPTQPLYQH
jgi:hypothetical protein